MHLSSTAPKTSFCGTDLLSLSKSLAIVLCVFISCFSIQFFCVQRKKREQGWIATLLWKTKTILSPMPIFSLYFHRVKRSARAANSARLSQWEAKCVHDYSKISSSCCTGTKKHFLRQTPLVCVHTFQNMQWVATIPFRVKRIGLML